MSRLYSIALVAVLMACAHARAETNDKPAEKPADKATKPAARVVLKEGEPAPWIAAFDLNGDPRNLDRLLGKRGVRGAVVAFWAAWCKPCRHELGLLAQGREKLAKQGIELFLVNLLDEPSKIEEVIAEKHLEGITLVRDSTGAISEQVGASLPGQTTSSDLKLPLSLVVAARGKTIKKIYSGDAPETIVQDTIDLLASEPVRGQ